MTASPFGYNNNTMITYEMAKIAFAFVGNNRKDGQKESSNIFDKTYNNPDFLLNLKHTPHKNIVMEPDNELFSGFHLPNLHFSGVSSR